MQQLRPRMVSETYFATTSYNTKGAEWNRPRGLPDLGEQLSMQKDEEDLLSRKTPYRLPRLPAGDRVQPDDGDYRVWSRHGYEYYTQPPVDMAAIISQRQVSPREASQRLRRANLVVPKFQSAMISPAPRHSAKVAPPETDFYRNFPPPGQASLPEDSLLDDYLAGNSPPPPISRTASPAKSAHSIHWTLSPFKNLHFDKKGRGRAQGPYSREFTVTCSAPTNWLRMKLGRSKTALT